MNNTTGAKTMIDGKCIEGAAGNRWSVRYFGSEEYASAVLMEFSEIMLRYFEKLSACRELTVCECNLKNQLEFFLADSKT